MAYIIPSKNIFDVRTNKVIDNIIDAVQITENKAKFKELKIERNFPVFLEEKAETNDKWKTYYMGNEELSFKRIHEYDNYVTGTTIETTIPNYIDATSISVSFEYDFIIIDSFGGVNLTNYVGIRGLLSNQQTVSTEKNNFSDNNVSYFNVQVFPPSGFTVGEASPYTLVGYNNIFSVKSEYGGSVSNKSKTPKKNIKISHTFNSSYELPWYIGINNSNHVVLAVRNIKMIITALELDTSETEERIIGDQNGQNLFKINQNEFGSTYTTIDGKSALENVANTILNGYKNGRETATVVCGVSEFKTHEGEETKSLFSIGDSVVPIILVDNDDFALSHDKEQKAKSFIVANTNIKFDGEILQELTIIEDFSETLVVLKKIRELTEYQLQTMSVTKNIPLKEGRVYKIGETFVTAVKVPFDHFGQKGYFIGIPAGTAIQSSSGLKGTVDNSYIRSEDGTIIYTWFINWDGPPNNTKKYNICLVL